jgi:glycosyltransferase involved in cell wall biosynthesis
MKVFLAPTGICEHARAFRRIAAALARYAPPHITITTDRDSADLVILYAISLDAVEAARDIRAWGKDYAVVQCCVAPTICPIDWWGELWAGAVVTWSYYDLSQHMDPSWTFYHAPLGIDDVFKQPQPAQPRNLVITTGYVDGPGAEAISEVWRAVSIVNSLPGQPFALQPLHIGPKHVQGMVNVPSNWHNEEGVTDERLAHLYSRAKFVSGLRHVEGFELPAAEALACGARPVVFWTQPTMRHWYGDLAQYVDECSGDELVSQLVAEFSEPWPVEDDERAMALKRFDWETIVTGFWNRIGV